MMPLTPQEAQRQFIEQLDCITQLEKAAEDLLTIPPIGLNALKRMGYEHYGFGQGLAKAGLPNLAVALMDFHHLPHGLNLVVNQYALTPFGTNQRVLSTWSHQHLLTAEVRIAAALSAVKALTELKMPPEGLELQWPNATATLNAALNYVKEKNFSRLFAEAVEAEMHLRVLMRNPAHQLSLKVIARATGRVLANLEDRVLG